MDDWRDGALLLTKVYANGGELRNKVSVEGLHLDGGKLEVGRLAT